MSQLKRNIVCSVTAIIGIVTGGTLYNSAAPSPAIEPTHGVEQVTDAYPPPIGDVIIAGERVGHLFISQRALEVIGDAEGCRRAPYKCPAGLLTDGIGNTHGSIGKPKTDEQIAKDWVLNIIDAQHCLVSVTPIETLTQGQRDAMVSFIFNTGCTTFKNNRNGTQTRIAKHARAGNLTAACHELNDWVYGGGVKLKGLITRRRIETEMCLAG
ncbi:lysozyme [Vibrio aestuarianus]|uniref:lysozyme n=1 Tax=Vibrio aestuarianus TaxID=28171 RepID=UPI0015932989|nr:lysozyme [Vibrio aestuarianus]NGZ18011.1 lysozyme [Vibrio aestuarianus]